MNKIFSSVAGNHPALNRFDLSHTKTMSCSIGKLYIAQCNLVYPSDVFKMSAYCHCEVQPMVAPLMSDLQIFAHSFFVPMRILYGVDTEDGIPIWEKYITGGKSGDYDVPLTPWTPEFDVTDFNSNTIWDYVGNPMSWTLGEDSKHHWKPIVPYGLDVLSAPKLAYNKIWNDFYRDENLQDEMTDLYENEFLLNVSFKKDYFTSALEQQQRGISPAIPVTGDLTVSGTADIDEITGNLGAINPVDFYLTAASAGTMPFKNGVVLTDSSGTKVTTLNTPAKNVCSTTLDGVPYNGFSSNVDLSQATLNATGSGTVSGTASGQLTAVNINQLRLMFAQQRLLELSERGGYRYTENLQSHWGVSPRDDRLDRPEYIGGCIIPINVSPTVQTGNQGAGSTPQGNKAGIGSADSIQKIGNYRVLEYGVIMTLISVRPKPIYQQGVNRQWLPQDRFSFYSPEFAYISETGVYNAELYCDGSSESERKDNDIFGYQAAWNELRCEQNKVCGPVREQFDYWTTARKFANRPALNEDFIVIKDDDFNRVFAVQDEDEFIISWSNLIDAYRPLPAMGVPGLVDHVYGGR